VCSRDFGQTRSRELVGAVKKCKKFQAQFRVLQSCSLSTSCVSKDRKMCVLFPVSTISK